MLNRGDSLINLFFSDSAAGSGACHREKFGLELDSIYGLGLFLHTGDISVPFSVSKRRDVYNAYFKLDWAVSKQIIRLKKALKNDKQLCLWYTKSDVDEYLGMLATLYQFNGKGITFYKCDCSDICECIAYLQQQDKIGDVHISPFSNNEILELLSEWERISLENSALRVLNDGKVISLSADYIDDRIYSIIGDNETKIADICSQILQQADMSRKLNFILLRIRQLLSEGKIDLVVEGYTQNNAHYGAPMKDIMKCIVKRNRGDF